MYFTDINECDMDNSLCLAANNVRCVDDTPSANNSQSRYHCECKSAAYEMIEPSRCIGTLKFYLHVCHNIWSFYSHFDGQNRVQPTLSIKVSVTIDIMLNFNSDVTCKQTLMDEIIKTNICWNRGLHQQNIISNFAIFQICSLFFRRKRVWYIRRRLRNER